MTVSYKRGGPVRLARFGCTPGQFEHIEGNEVGSIYISFFSCLRGRRLELSVLK